MKKVIANSLIKTSNSTFFTKTITRLERMDQGSPNLLRVLTYHRICEPGKDPGAYPRIMVTPAAFEQQMRHLAAQYRVISMPEVLQHYQQHRPLPARALLVTIDDAYCDFAEIAWPIMRRYGVPATLFVPTAFPDQPERVFWWDWLYRALALTERREPVDTAVGALALTTPSLREQAFSRLRDYFKTLPHQQAMSAVEQVCEQLKVARPDHAVLGWRMLRQLAAEGVTLGAHTQHHPLMNRISPTEMYAEAVGSRQDLQREIGEALPIFAYPSGGFNDEVVAVLAKADFSLAFTTGSGINRFFEANPLLLRRVNVGPRTTLPLLQAQLLSWSMYL